MTHLKNLSASLWLSHHSSSCHPFIFANPQGMVRLVLLWIIVGMVISSPFLCFAEESLIPEDPADRVGPGIPICLKWMANIQITRSPATICMWAFVGNPTQISPKILKLILRGN